LEGCGGLFEEGEIKPSWYRVPRDSQGVCTSAQRISIPRGHRRRSLELLLQDNGIRPLLSDPIQEMNALVLRSLSSSRESPNTIVKKRSLPESVDLPRERQDESGVSRWPSMRRTWAPRGETPVLIHAFN